MQLWRKSNVFCVTCFNIVCIKSVKLCCTKNNSSQPIISAPTYCFFCRKKLLSGSLDFWQLLSVGSFAIKLSLQKLQDVDLLMYLLILLSQCQRTRGHPYKIYRQPCRLNVSLYSFANRIIDIWNNLPFEILASPVLLYSEESLTLFILRLLF